MRSLASSPAWVAGFIALWALLRGLRRLVGADDRPLAMAVAIGLVVVVALLPTTWGRRQPRDTVRTSPTAEGAAARKAVQLLGAAGVVLLAVYLGAGVIIGAALGLGAAALVPLLWPPPRTARRAGDHG